MTYSAAKRKFRLERIGMFPFVLLGRIAGHIFRLKTKHNIFLFFPSADIGGAPQVNIDISNCIKDKKPLIIFSKKPKNNQFRDKFEVEGVRILDIHKYIDNKLFHFINFFYRGLLATWINKEKDAVVFGGESLYFYKVIPHLQKHVHVVELCHLDTWFPYSIGLIDYIDQRVFSTEALKSNAEDIYRKNQLPASYFEKLFFIDNAIDIPVYEEKQNEWMQVYFIGRGAPQKRVHLVAGIAKQIHDKGLPVKFNFVGDVDRIINTDDYPFCRFYGNVSDQSEMKRIYQEADVLLMTSSFEGLPIVVMQMMAHGKTVVSTAVNGIPDYIHHMENGLLIKATAENEIINEGSAYIEMLQKDPALRTKLGKRSREIAIEKFSMNIFCKIYRQWLKADV